MKKLILLLLCAVSSFSLAATQDSDGSNLRDSIFRKVADRLIALGVQGIWNFTNVELTVQRFENVHFADSLLTLKDIYHPAIFPPE